MTPSPEHDSIRQRLYAIAVGHERVQHQMGELGDQLAEVLSELANGANVDAHHAGDFGISRREAEILNRIVQGQTNADIARELWITEKTVKNHVNSIYGKLRAHSRAEAIAVWIGLREAG